MSYKQVKSLDELEKAIKHLLLESRYSFTEEEKGNLNEVLNLIQRARETEDVIDVWKVFRFAVKLFIADHLKDLF